MTHYHLKNDEPTAIVTVKGSEKKIYDNNQIYLNSDDTFELRFFNPLSEEIGVKINFNGENKNNELLILRPGEDLTLNRFIGEKKKMKFSTYFIDKKNEKATKAIEKNGLIEINFYKKEQYWIYNKPLILQDPPPCNPYPTWPSYPTFPSYPNTNPYEIICNDNTNYNIYTSNVISTTYNTSNMNSVSSTIETGRIDKGDDSTQNFEKSIEDFSIIPFHKITYKLLPYSEQTKVRNYCPECGYRIRKKSYNYCPLCGEEL